MAECQNRTVLQGSRGWNQERPLFPQESQSAGVSYTMDITDLSQWGAPVDGLYTISIPATVHLLSGEYPVYIYQTVEDSLVRLNLEYTIDNAGTLLVRVTEAPDYRFLGRINLGDF